MTELTRIQELQETDKLRTDAERVAYVTGVVRRIQRSPERKRKGAVARSEIERYLDCDQASTTREVLDRVLRVAISARMVKVSNGLFWLLFVGLLVGCDATTTTAAPHAAGNAGAWTESDPSAGAPQLREQNRQWAAGAAGAPLVAGAAGAAGAPLVAGAAGAAGAPLVAGAAGAAGAPLVAGAAGAAGAPSDGQGGASGGVAGAAGAAGAPLVAGAAGAAGATAKAYCPYCDETTCGGCAFRRANGARYLTCDAFISCG